MRRGGSLPVLGNPRRSPLSRDQGLCTADVKRRVLVKELVGEGGARVIESKRMPFVAFERGIEWERSCVRVKVPKDPLPPLGEVLRAIRQMDMEPLTQEERLERRHKPKAAFGGSGHVKIGPSLPMRRPPITEVSQLAPPWQVARRKEVEAQDTVEQRDIDLDCLGMQPHVLLTVGGDVSGDVSGLLPPGSARRDGPSPRGDRPQDPLALSLGGTGTVAGLTGTGESSELTRSVEEVDLPFPWTGEELRRLFCKFDTDFDGEVHKDEMPAMLQYLGARKSPDAAKRIVEAQTRYATLNYEEFVEFLGKFREWDVQQLREEFKSADKDHGGFLDFEELYSLLHELGYAPTTQTTLEALEEIDTDGNGTVDLCEFDGLREHLRRTEGMCKADVWQLQELYTKTMDNMGDTNREPAAEEVWRITMYLGYSVTVHEIAALAKNVDEDGSSALSFEELMKLIRLVREKEKEDMIGAISKYGNDPLALPLDDLGLALADLGYYVSEDAVFEILDTLGELKTEDSLTIEEVSSFMRRYRMTEGFLDSEREELEEAFNRNKVQSTESLRTLDVGRVLRWFGFFKTVQEVQNLVKWIDFDCSGELELPEFFKLMRRMFQDEAKERSALFDSMANKHTAEIPSTVIPAMLVALHRSEPNTEFLEKALEWANLDGSRKLLRTRGAGLDEEGGGSAIPSPRRPPAPLPFADASEGGAAPGCEEQDKPRLTFFNKPAFEAFYRHYRHLVVAEVHANCGYNATEVANLRASFISYDKDKSGTVERLELSRMLGDYFPDSTKSKEGQKDIMRALQEVDKDGNGELCFMEFLLLMRKCDDARDSKDLSLELHVVRECGFTAEEVEGFRQIFTENVDWKGELCLETLGELLGKVIELSWDKAEELARMVREVHPEGREVARFPQFLKLIKRMMEDNYGHVNDLAARLVRREAMREKGLRP